MRRRLEKFKKIDWRLNNWPPLASHLVAVFVGVGLVNISAKTPAPKLSVPANGMLINLGEDVPKHTAKPSDNVAGGKWLLATLNSSGLLQCRLGKRLLTAASADRASLVSLPLSQLKDFHQEYFEAIKRYPKQIVLTPLRDGEKLPVCRKESRISYGKK